MAVEQKGTQMNKIGMLFLMLTLVAVAGVTQKAPADLPDRIKELNSYWAEVSRCVKEGDFTGYKATCHPEGVIVSGTSQKAYPLSALYTFLYCVTDE
jgi:hypothetical protein